METVGSILQLVAKTYYTVASLSIFKMKERMRLNIVS